MSSTKMSRNRKRREAKLTIHEKIVIKRNEDFERVKEFAKHVENLKTQ